MKLVDELFSYVEIRQRLPEERLYRMIDEVLAAEDASLHRITWDWYDCSVEIYLDSNEVPKLDLTKLWEAGFALVWVHPFRCTKDGHRDHDNCRCPAAGRPGRFVGSSLADSPTEIPKAPTK